MPARNASLTAETAAVPKRARGDFGALPIEIPRDRDGSFEPQCWRALKIYQPGMLTSDPHFRI